ncbi:MAG: bifunctional 4-hydroxy-2-oxoglutarate aldolase/2-dehydro-3-deoxy-phosphogluconate aldolase [Candidatus Gastranaerophilales bacterium]|nr:bifunctional 4-hydroxy-2-oxoglutarate aldolase/2-dehydro-3-deoxy-phosphogluconate aldolase [Candidatus Gastranaerophilales bacterium]
MNQIEKISAEKIFAVLRMQETNNIKDIINALVNGGINIIEIVIESPATIKIVEEITRKKERPMIMAGGIITQRQAQIAINSGADVIVSPVFQMNLVRICESQKIPLIMTATTPNEAYSAWKARTRLIKISPSNPMGGAEYIEDMLRPMNFINVIAAGSIKINDIPSYLKAGVKAVGLGRALYKDADFDEIKKRAEIACKKTLNIEGYNDKVNF